jgi:predicted hydrocarbon binding protein
MAKRELLGSTILSYLDYIKKKKGLDAYERCLKETGLINIQKAKRYPDTQQHEVLLWIQKNYGDQVIIKAGRYSAMSIGALDFIAKMGTIDLMMKFAKIGYSRTLFFGTIETKKIDKKNVQLILTDSTTGRVNCLAWEGLIAGLTEMTGAKPTVKEIECRHEGGKKCVFDLTW